MVSPDVERTEPGPSQVEKTVLEILERREREEVFIGGVFYEPINTNRTIGRFTIFVAPPSPLYDLEKLNEFAIGLITTTKPKVEPPTVHGKILIAGTISIAEVVGTRRTTVVNRIAPISEELSQKIASIEATSIEKDHSEPEEQEVDLRRALNVIVYPHDMLAHIVAVRMPRGNDLTRGLISMKSLKRIQEAERRGRNFPLDEFPAPQGGGK